MSYSLGIEIIRSREGFLPRPSLNGLVGFRMDSRCLMLSVLESSHQFRLQFPLFFFFEVNSLCLLTKQNNAKVSGVHEQKAVLLVLGCPPPPRGRAAFWLLPFVSEKRKRLLRVCD